MKTSMSSKVIGIEGYRVEHQNQSDSVDVARLALRLQQTLEITPLLQAFCHETARIVPCDSVSYINSKTSLSHETGQAQPHRCTYQLELEGESLGEVACTRSRPFSIKETDLIERLLSLLIYPLRNALLYQKAVADSYRDPLTQISNRAAFDDALSRETSANQRHQSDFSLLLIDVDYFKNVNDSYGHIVGDQVLKTIASSIKGAIRRSDEVFRYGGEEFVVLLSNTRIEGARFIAERIRREIKELAIKSTNEVIQVTASIGVSATNATEKTNQILALADTALYEAKANGRDQVVASI